MGRRPESDDLTELTARAQADVVDLAIRAEEYGFGTVWVGNSVAKLRFDPLVALLAAASATEAVTLSTAVYLSNLCHPVNVAHQMATLDQVSGGYLTLRISVGSRLFVANTSR